MTSLRTCQMLLAAVLCVSCGKESDRPTMVPASQMGDNLCNIAALASIFHDNSVGAQVGLDLAKLARLPISGNIGGTVNDKVTSIFQSVPQHSAVCQMLLQAISCASAMKNQSVAEAMTHQLSEKCPSEKPLNSPERAKILERIIVLKSEIDIATQAIEEAGPKTNVAGKSWQEAKASAERESGSSEAAELQAKADKLETSYQVALRTEMHYRNEKKKRELEVASLRAQIE